MRKEWLEPVIGMLNKLVGHQLTLDVVATLWKRCPGESQRIFFRMLL